MKKFLLLLPLLLVACSTPAAPTPEPEPTHNTYSNTELGVTFDYPLEWEVTETTRQQATYEGDIVPDIHTISLEDNPFLAFTEPSAMDRGSWWAQLALDSESCPNKYSSLNCEEYTNSSGTKMLKLSGNYTGYYDDAIYTEFYLMPSPNTTYQGLALSSYALDRAGLATNDFDMVVNTLSFL